MADYSEYQGKRVTLTLSNPEEGGENLVLEGKIDVANAAAILFKAKGRSNLEMYENDRVLSVETAPEKPKALKAKNLKEVEATGVKQHLVDRHGYKLTDINALEDDAAHEFHSDLDHSDLGHVHKGEDETASASEGDSSEAA